MAMTGYYRTMTRPRTSKPMSMLKYDPVGAWGQSLLPFYRWTCVPCDGADLASVKPSYIARLRISSLSLVLEAVLANYGTLRHCRG